MKPLYYAIMKYMTTVEEASNMDVIHALKKDYGTFKMLRPDAVQEALMTAKANGLLDESRFELDDTDQLQVYYKVNDYGRQMINAFIKD